VTSVRRSVPFRSVARRCEYAIADARSLAPIPAGSLSASSRRATPSLMSVVLRVLTPDVEASARAVNAPLSVTPCESTYSCRCKRCTAERAILVRTGSRDRTQPWMTRKAA
jgi:hypothetical protein